MLADDLVRSLIKISRYQSGLKESLHGLWSETSWGCRCPVMTPGKPPKCVHVQQGQLSTSAVWLTAG